VHIGSLYDCARVFLLAMYLRVCMHLGGLVFLAWTGCASYPLRVPVDLCVACATAGRKVRKLEAKAKGSKDIRGWFGGS